jgi:hypothetical protein
VRRKLPGPDGGDGGSNGAPNFPDPKGLSVAVDIRPGPIGVAFNGPAFRRAQAKCRTAKPHPLAMSRGH